MNLLICGESYTGKTTIGRAIAKQLDWEVVEVSGLAGKGDRKTKAAREDKIIEGLKSLNGNTDRVIIGLRQLSLLNYIKGDTFIVYISASQHTRADFFLKREGMNNTDKYNKACLVDDMLGVKELADIANLHFVIDKKTANETAWCIVKYVHAEAHFVDQGFDEITNILELN